jgi:hypothetical protein
MLRLLSLIFGLPARLRTWNARRKLAGRGLFEYWDGRGWQWADPLRLYREIRDQDLHRLSGFLELQLEPDTTQFYERLCGIFRVERFDPVTGRGLSDAELMDLFESYADFMELLKKSTSLGPISSEPTDSALSIFPAHPGEATSSPVDSSPMPSESKSAKPIESSTEPTPASAMPSAAP